MIRSFLLMIAVTAMALTTGCGRLKSFCDTDAARLDSVVGQALTHDVLTVYFEETLGHTDVSELANADLRRQEPRLQQLSDLMNLIETDREGHVRANARQSLDALCRRGADGACEVSATQRPRPDRDKLTQLQQLAQGLRATYCQVAVPQERCLAALNRLSFGRYPETEAACAKITTDAGARCVDIAVATHSLDIPAAEIEACAPYYHPNHLACAAAVATLGFGINSDTLDACGQVWSNGAMACVRAAVAAHTNDIPAAAISACYN